MSQRKLIRLEENYRKNLKEYIKSFLFLVQDVKTCSEWECIENEIAILVHRWKRFSHKTNDPKKYIDLFQECINQFKTILILEDVYGAISSLEEIQKCKSSSPEEKAIEIIMTNKYTV